MWFLTSPPGNPAATNVALSPPTVVGNGFHQQPPHGAGPSAGQFSAPGHYGGTGSTGGNNGSKLPRSAWEKKYGADPNFWLELSSVDPKSGNFSVKIEDIPYGQKQPPTGMFACFAAGKSFVREGATAPEFLGAL